jgi:hypothetical protein
MIEPDSTGLWLLEFSYGILKNSLSIFAIGPHCSLLEALLFENGVLRFARKSISLISLGACYLLIGLKK